MKGSIFLVEDDDSLGFVTQDNLQEEGYHVSWFKNGREAWEAYQEQNFDLCLLDVMLPAMDGFELARKIRAVNEFIPIIFLTARIQEEDRLSGFEIGGDDYISKPFSMQELLYRVAVFMRRTSVHKNETESQQAIGTYAFDQGNLKLIHDEETINLTQMEGQLLSMLIEKMDELVRREDILVRIWGENDYFKGRSLDVFISRLRKYLKHDMSLSIKNHHGVGFTLSKEA
jgi:DNA-binding response OmpR family regulator